MSLKLLSVASEAVPLIKTGGLADVVGALPTALAPHNVAATTMLPGYPAVMQAISDVKLVHDYPALFGQPARIVAANAGSMPLLILDAPGFFARDGGPYSDANGQDWPDNWRRFAAFGRAAADVAGGMFKGWSFDLVHAHDWQAAMTLAYLRFAPPKRNRTIRSVMTIHNMAFQGYYPARIFTELGLPRSAWAIDGVESYGGVGFLKAGLEAADIITTVSPRYAREIRQSEFGMGLDGLIRSRGDKVVGLLNGIDATAWNPANDPAIAQPFALRSLAKRIANKRVLEAEFGLDANEGPLFIVVSRLTWQKGMDVLVEVLDHLVGMGGRLALLGTGDRDIIEALQQREARHPGRISVKVGYDEALAHRMQAGGDAILVPSRFEPCGLTQLYGLAYGCVPVVASTGGLADTVIDANAAALATGVATGVQFHGVNYASLADAIDRTIALWHDANSWRSLQRAGMKADFTWQSCGKAYADLFHQLTGTS
jgi:starch synthase